MIKMNTIGIIEKGNTCDQIRKMTRKKPKTEFSVSDSTGTYDVLLYHMRTGTYFVWHNSTTFNPFTGVSSSTSYASTESTTEDFAFLFGNGRLIYWGFLNEFGKADDARAVALGSEINENINSKRKRRR